MSNKKYQWFKIAESSEALNWQSNNMCVVEADGKKITLAKHQEKIFAVAYKCPHASGIMAAGNIDSLGNIVCPLHRYKFNLITGRNTTGEGYYLKTYAIEQKVDGVYIGFEVGGLFGGLF